MTKNLEDSTGAKIRRLRQDRGLTMQELSDRIGVHFTTLAKWERSHRTMNLETATKLAEALDISVGDLLTSTGEHRSIRMIPVAGTIPAGNWREAISDPLGYVPVPDAGPNVFALKPIGDSMDKLIADGGYIVVDPDQLDLRDGRAYAVMNGGGETTFKRYRADPARLEPCSSNPAHQPIMLGREPFTVVGRIVWVMEAT